MNTARALALCAAASFMFALGAYVIAAANWYVTVLLLIGLTFLALSEAI